jgi:uncharacterized membrane protein
VEGVIDHQLLQLHNVIEPAQEHNPANYVFLIMSVLLIIAGFLLCRKRYRTKKLSILAIF